jgi:hypothetical protein
VNAPARTVHGNALVDRDVAQLLYEHGVGGLFVTAAAGTAFVVMRPGLKSKAVLIAWLCIMMLTVVARALDLAAGRKRRARSDWNGCAEIERFRRGVFASAVVWAALPLLFFREMNQVERTTMAIVLSAMAGGSATVLAPVQRLAIVYCGAMLVPASLMFLLTPGNANDFLGLLGIVFFVVMASSSRVTNRAAMAAIRLNRANQALMQDMDQERRRTERANAELTVAQSALHETLGACRCCL